VKAAAPGFMVFSVASVCSVVQKQQVDLGSGLLGRRIQIGRPRRRDPAGTRAGGPGGTKGVRYFFREAFGARHYVTL
jgi:hypothetical protein